MKAILWKELRENASWAVLALVLVGIANIFGYYMTVPTQNPTPLWETKIAASVVFAAIAGAVLGAVQILPELRRDQWAFLLHRPAAASRIFAGKVAAGILLLAIAVLIPDMVTYYWLRFHLGHEIVSFWYVAVSAYIGLTTAIVFYLAAVIAALRPARVFGSRLLSIATACAVVIALFAIRVAPAWWQSLALAGLCIVILTVAANGCFAARGEYRRMTAPARAALAIVLLIGGATVGYGVTGFAGIFVSDILGREYFYQYRDPSRSVAPPGAFLADQQGRILYTHWQYERQGKVAQFIKAQIMPEGRPILLSSIEERQGNFLSMQVLRSQGRVLTRSGGAPPLQRSFLQGRYRNINAGAETQTYYDAVGRRIVFYSFKTRRITGYSGPGGYYDVGSVPANGQAVFPGELLNRPTDRFLLFTDGIFRVDDGGRAVKHIVAAKPGQTIQNCVPGSVGNTQVLWVVTNTTIEQYDLDGKLLGAAPLEPDEASSPFIGVITTPNGKSLYWLGALHTDGQGVHELRSKIVETTATGKVLRRFTLPGLGIDDGENVPPVQLFTTAALPIVRTNKKILRLADWGEWRGKHLFGLSYRSPNALVPFRAVLLSALLSAAAVWFIALRAGLKLPARLLWVVLALPLGLAAVIGLLALCAWPVRLSCGQCGKKSNIELDNCEHCKTPWPRPQRDGTEIITREFEIHALVAGGQG